MYALAEFYRFMMRKTAFVICILTDAERCDSIKGDREGLHAPEKPN